MLDLVNDTVTEYNISDLKTTKKEDSGSGLMGVISGLWGSK